MKVFIFAYGSRENDEHNTLVFSMEEKVGDYRAKLIDKWEKEDKESDPEYAADEKFIWSDHFWIDIWPTEIDPKEVF